MELVYRAVSIEAFRIPVPTRIWVLIAKGETTSTGWSNARLVPQGEQDGYLQLNFEAQAPEEGEITLPVIVPIIAVATISPSPGIKGMVVQAQTNTVSIHTSILTIDAAGQENHDFIPYEMDQAIDEIDAEDLNSDDAHNELASPELLAAGLRTLAPVAGYVCKSRTLLKVPLYPEFKTKGWKFYKRWRYNITELYYCYPSAPTDAVREILNRCLPIAVAAGVAGFAAGGPAGALAAFKTSFEGCATAEVIGSLKVKVRNRQEKGKWHRI